jgi:hypothetical protein
LFKAGIHLSGRARLDPCSAPPRAPHAGVPGTVSPVSRPQSARPPRPRPPGRPPRPRRPARLRPPSGRGGSSAEGWGSVGRSGRGRAGPPPDGGSSRRATHAAQSDGRDGRAFDTLAPRTCIPPRAVRLLTDMCDERRYERRRPVLPPRRCRMAMRLDRMSPNDGLGWAGRWAVVAMSATKRSHTRIMVPTCTMCLRAALCAEMAPPAAPRARLADARLSSALCAQHAAASSRYSGGVVGGNSGCAPSWLTRWPSSAAGTPASGPGNGVGLGLWGRRHAFA